MMYRELRRSRRESGERGSVSLWLVIFSLAVLILLAFIVDGGQYMNARERAADIAEQAARAGADQVSVASLRQGTFVIPQAAACAAAQTLVTQYATGALSASNQAGTSMASCTTNGPTVTVQVSVTVTPVLSAGIFGTFTTHATESATLRCGSATQTTGAC
jgi:Flp pilus assembly protein TadG